MNDGIGPEFLMIPGPTPVPARVLAALAQQSVDFSSAAFIETADRLFERLKPLFGTDAEVFLYSANGHGAWEASLANTINSGESILIPETGLFSEAWRSMAKGLGIQCETIPSDWRHAIDPNIVEQRLREDTAKKIKAVLVVHTDTATSISSDVAAVADAIRAASHPALLMVDTIASLCTTPFHMQRMGVDVAVCASQKALMAPPGLSLVAVTDRALRYSQTIEQPRHYWCWRERLQGEHYKRFCGTAPEQLVFALSESLSMIYEEGLERTIERHQRLANVVRATVDRWSEPGFLEFNAVEPTERANSVTTVRTPNGFDAETIRDELRRSHNVTIGGGLGELHGKIFRIGHMGHINLAYVVGSLAALDATLKLLTVPIGRDAIEAGLNAYSN